MKEILTYVMLDGSKEDEEKFFDGTIKEIDIEQMMSTAREVVGNTIFETFFEEPEVCDIMLATKFVEKEKRAELDIYLSDELYNKHIGKYMDGEETLLKFMMRLEEALDKVCWKSAAGHGCGGGCHG